MPENLYYPGILCIPAIADRPRVALLKRPRIVLNAHVAPTERRQSAHVALTQRRQSVHVALTHPALISLYKLQNIILLKYCKYK